MWRPWDRNKVSTSEEKQNTNESAKEMRSYKWAVRDVVKEEAELEFLKDFSLSDMQNVTGSFGADEHCRYFTLLSV